MSGTHDNGNPIDKRRSPAHKEGLRLEPDGALVPPVVATTPFSTPCKRRSHSWAYRGRSS